MSKFTVSGMHLRVNVRGIVEEQIEDKLALMIVGTDQIGVHRDMISNQGIGHYPLVEAKIFRGIACIECGFFAYPPETVYSFRGDMQKNQKEQALL